MSLLNFRRFGLWLCSLLSSLIAASSAFAHHAMGGETPSTFEQGFISGLAHPVIGVDHLAFILGVGLAAAFLSKRLLTIGVFVLATVAGCVLQLQAIALPAAEVVIAASVIGIGVLILSGMEISGRIYLALFAVAGLFHGWAYGASIVGAEQTPLAAYLAGFSLVQFLIAAAAMFAARFFWLNQTAVPLRIAGGAVAGFGAAFLIENIETLILPAVA